MSSDAPSRDDPSALQTIETAPRNGLTILVSAEGCGEWPMAWNPTGENPVFQRGIGIWETPDRSFTWSEERGLGPTHWRHLPPVEGRRASTESSAGVVEG